MLVQRGVELVVSRRNQARLLARGGVRCSPDGFWPIAFVHGAIYVALPLEWMVAPWTGTGAHTAPALVLALAASAWRGWAAVTLGDHYTVRVIRVPHAPLVCSGPYRWMRHPIYQAVAIELPMVALAFGAIATGLAVFLLQGWALTRRIRVEERFLARNQPT